jgi:hydrogenase maturation protease
MSGASTAEPAGRAGDTMTAPTLIVGIGNPIAGDDGVGWRVVEDVQAVVGGARAGVAFDWLATGGLALMERLTGERRAIIVDAIVSGVDPPGTVRCHAMADLPSREATHLDSAHDVTFAGAMAIGRSLGASLPDEVQVVTVEAARVDELREDLTPAVEAAVPVAVAAVLELLAAGNRAFDDDPGARSGH